MKKQRKRVLQVAIPKAWMLKLEHFDWKSHNCAPMYFLQQQLAQATTALAQAEVRLKSDEDTIAAAAMRAIADAREGTARQEGHIKSLNARLEAIAEEIARLTKARDEAQARVDQAKREYSSHELEIASADSGELGLDSQYENSKSALESSKCQALRFS
jgi:chromosome segregation protein